VDAKCGVAEVPWHSNAAASQLPSLRLLAIAVLFLIAAPRHLSASAFSVPMLLRPHHTRCRSGFEGTLFNEKPGGRCQWRIVVASESGSLVGRSSPYSVFNASTGFTRLALRAGRKAARAATPRRMAGTPTKVTGSKALVP